MASLKQKAAEALEKGKEVATKAKETAEKNLKEAQDQAAEAAADATKKVKGKGRKAKETAAAAAAAVADQVTAAQIEAYNAQYKKEVKQLKEYLYEYIPKKTVDSKMRGEWFFDADEAVELGVAHRIIDTLDDVI